MRKVPMKKWALVISIVWLLRPGIAMADTSVNTSNNAAYSANAGWLNMRGDVTNGVVMGQLFCTGYIWSANCGWIGMGNGPTNGWRYTNTSGNDWGVNHDAAGALSGYAYGANLGWINFEQTYGKPWLNLASGIMTGFVWSANAGWISLSNAQAFVRTDRLSSGPDRDNDGIPDPWERRMTGNTNFVGSGDADFDGQTDLNEYLADTDPLNASNRLSISSFSTLTGTNQLAWPVTQTRRYELQQANVLTGTVSWADSGYGVMPPDSGSNMTRNIARSASETSRFYRVRAVLPLSP